MKELVPLRKEKHFKPHPQALDTSEGFFSKFPTSTPVLFRWEFPSMSFPGRLSSPRVGGGKEWA